MGCINKIDLPAATLGSIQKLVQANQAANKASWQSNKSTIQGLWAAYYAALIASPAGSAAVTDAENAITAQMTSMQSNMQANMANRFKLDSEIVQLIAQDPNATTELANLNTCLESKTTPGAEGSRK